MKIEACPFTEDKSTESTPEFDEFIFINPPEDLNDNINLIKNYFKMANQKNVRKNDQLEGLVQYQMIVLQNSKIPCNPDTESTKSLCGEISDSLAEVQKIKLLEPSAQLLFATKQKVNDLFVNAVKTFNHLLSQLTYYRAKALKTEKKYNQSSKNVETIVGAGGRMDPVTAATNPDLMAEFGLPAGGEDE